MIPDFVLWDGDMFPNRYALEYTRWSELIIVRSLSSVNMTFCSVSIELGLCHGGSTIVSTGVSWILPKLYCTGFSSSGRRFAHIVCN